MTQRRPTSSVAALVLARVIQAKATRDDDPDLMEVANEVENRALAAIRLRLPVLPEKKPRQLRLPGL